MSTPSEQPLAGSTPQPVPEHLQSTPGYPPQQPPGYPGQPGYGHPPLVRPEELRPRRWWYAIAGGVALLGVVGSIGGLLLQSAAIPDLEQNFATGETITISLDKGEERTIHTELGHEGHEATCRASAGLTGRKPTSYESSMGSYREMYLVFVVTSNHSGKHQIQCTSDQAAELGITEAFHRKSNERKDAAGYILFLGAPFVGVIAAKAIAVVVAIRRKSHKDRLMRERIWG